MAHTFDHLRQGRVNLALNLNCLGKGGDDVAVGRQLIERKETVFAVFEPFMKLRAAIGTRRLSIVSEKASLATPRGDRARHARLSAQKSAVSWVLNSKIP